MTLQRIVSIFFSGAGRQRQAALRRLKYIHTLSSGKGAGLRRQALSAKWGLVSGTNTGANAGVGLRRQVPT
jgi:hypothetical protein